jgi:TnpA family transposase
VQYEQMVKYTTALRLKTAEPENLLKRFTSNNLKHPVYQALQELGRAIKTIFLCRYLCLEELRQEIHKGLNVIERWNSVNDFIFYGRKSIISTNDNINQELAILSLHLLQACLVYVNTLMIQHILQLPHWQNKLTIKDKRAINPLIYAHINPYGIFKLDMNHRIAI